tara:strand:+ start:1164 stop:1487 length:324 start_codon:yes stop_codon:yes gene_type:complete
MCCLKNAGATNATQTNWCRPTTYRGIPMATRKRGGKHYTANTIQPWDVIDTYGLNFYAGNVLKYLLRSADGNPERKHPTPDGVLDDLIKAQHYMDKLVELQTDKLKQ